MQSVAPSTAISSIMSSTADVSASGAKPLANRCLLHSLRIMAAAEEDLAVETVVLAFAADPMARWTWPQGHRYLAAMPRMIRALGGSAFSDGSAFCTDGYAGTALWLSPGVDSDEEELGAAIESTVARSIAPETTAILEEMAAYHPTEPHWYLPLIGVDPAHQGGGHGDA